MSKEEFYNTYIKNDRTEDEKMLDIIHNQAETRRMNELMDKQLKRIEKEKRQKRNDRIAIIITIAVLIALIVTNYFVTQKGLESCVAGGHSESWCIVHG